MTRATFLKTVPTGLAILMPLALSACEDKLQPQAAGDPVAIDEPQEAVDIKAIDRAAGLMAREEGMAKTVRTYFAEDAIQLDDGKEMIDEGIDAIMLDHEKTIPQNLSVSWVPLGGEVSEANDMAYTWGRWSNVEYKEDGSMIDTYGKYVTIWRKQDDGSWKIEVDIWNSEDLAK